MRLGENNPTKKQSPLRSQDFLTLAQSYITAINSGGVPTIVDAWTEIVES